MKLNRSLLFLVFIVSTAIISCSKSSDDAVQPVVKTPKLGTTWTFQQDKFKPDNLNYITSTVTYKASSEVTLGGETWLKITDDTMAVVYLLNVKTGGLYQYDNNTSNLLCKSPGAVNDVYTGYNRGGNETFTVKQAGITIASGNGSSYSNVIMYEGYHGTELWDKIWYNDEVWFARRETWWHDPYPPYTYRRDRRMVLYSITY